MESFQAFIYLCRQSQPKSHQCCSSPHRSAPSPY